MFAGRMVPYLYIMSLLKEFFYKKSDNLNVVLNKCSYIGGFKIKMVKFAVS